MADKGDYLVVTPTVDKNLTIALRVEKARRQLVQAASWSCPGSVDSLALRIASCLGGQRQGCAFVV
jgi:hypothetical protein